jgi:hypothetical protein
MVFCNDQKETECLCLCAQSQMPADHANKLVWFHSGMSVMDMPVKCRKSVMFNDKAKVGALVQRVRAFKKQKLAEEAKEEAQEEQQALACAVST